jgi:hypothetical protein
MNIEVPEEDLFQYHAEFNFISGLIQTVEINRGISNLTPNFLKTVNLINEHIRENYSIINTAARQEPGSDRK